MSLASYIFVFLLSVATGFSQIAGKLQGAVNDDSGQPVPNAIAVATIQSLSDHSTFSAVTDTKGNFSFNSLPAGKYSVCIHTPGGPQLNPCQWSKDTQVTVPPGQTVANQVITVTNGSLLQVRINDPNHVLTMQDDLMMGVYLPNGLFLPLRLAASDPTGRTYDTAVPQKTSIRFTIISTHLQIADDQGKGLGAQPPAKGNTAPTAQTSTTITFPGQSALKGPPVTFTITGRK